MFLQLEKFNTFRGRDKKSDRKTDRSSFRPPGLEEFSPDGAGDANVQLLVNRMTEAEVNSKFEQMLVSTHYTVLLSATCMIGGFRCALTQHFARPETWKSPLAAMLIHPSPVA